MSRGPVPKPSLMKALAGNPGHRPISRNEPIPPPGAPRPPAWLSPRADAVWNQIAAPLIECKLITSIDWPLFGRYCEMTVHWLELKDLVEKTGQIQTLELDRKPARATKPGEPEVLAKKETIYGAEFPHAKAMRKLNGELVKMEDRLGMNPAVRSRITVPGSNQSEGVNPEEARRREILSGVAGKIGPKSTPAPENPGA